MPRYFQNASAYHRKIGEILTSTPEFQHHKVVQEYPVNKVNPDWYSSRHRFDWAILDLFIVIEVMGEQHTLPSRWSKDTSKDEASANLEATQFNDYRKREAAISAGWKYLAIQYWEVEELTAQQLLARVAHLSDEHSQRLPRDDRVCQYRKQQYRRWKNWYDKHKEERKLRGE